MTKTRTGDESRTFDSDHRKREINTPQLHTYLEKQDHSQLINLLDTIAERYPASP